jgi:hypothetical protein
MRKVANAVADKVLGPEPGPATELVVYLNFTERGEQAGMSEGEYSASRNLDGSVRLKELHWPIC